MQILSINIDERYFILSTNLNNEPIMTEDYFLYGSAKLGYGNFELPPILIGTMFYQGQTLIDRKNEIQFDVNRAKKRIDA